MMTKMKLICLVVTLSLSSLQAKVWSQHERLTEKFKNKNLAEVFDVLQKKTNLKFVFNYENVLGHQINVEIQNKNLAEALE